MSNPFNLTFPTTPAELQHALEDIVSHIEDHLEEEYPIEQLAIITPTLLLAIAALRGVVGSGPRQQIEGFVHTWLQHSQDVEATTISQSMLAEIVRVRDLVTKLRFRIDAKAFKQAQTMLSSAMEIANVSLLNQQRREEILKED